MRSLLPCASVGQVAAPPPDGRRNPVTDRRLHTRTAAPETGGSDIALTTESADFADHWVDELPDEESSVL